MKSLAARLTVVLGVVGGLVLGGAAVPAAACACAYVTNTGATVGQEQVAIKFVGGVEELVVSMSVVGSSPDAAWIMPVPAQAELSLEEDMSLFTELDERTQPREEKVTNWWPNLGFLDRLGVTTSDEAADDAGIEVLEQQVLGPLTTVQLAANDPAALSTWLQENGYQPNEAFATAADAYAQAGWVFVAVKLTQRDANTPLTGALQPLKLRFPSTEAVYPMRLSRLATTPQSVRLYVIAPNRVEPAFTAVPGSFPDLVYAGVLDPGEIGPVSRVGQWLTERAFLVRYDQTITEPGQITGDYTFAQSATDEEFRGVSYVDRDLGWLTGGLLAVLGLVLLAVVPTRILYRRRVRQEYESREYETVA